MEFMAWDLDSVGWVGGEYGWVWVGAVVVV